MILRQAPAGLASAIFSAILATIVSAPGSPAGAATTYADGTVIQITGLVTNRDGDPIPNVRLIFEASRRSFALRKMRKVTANPVRVATVSDAAGEYTLNWKWHRYYNHFEISVVAVVRRPGGKEHIEVLASVDLSQRIRQGSPVVAPVTVADTSFLDALRAFVASVQSPDERRIYDEMGKPDKVETLRFPERREVSWWYFAAGKTYRFTDGRLENVVDFEPIVGF